MEHIEGEVVIMKIREAVYRQIKELADDGEPIIYENHEINKRLNIETYVVIIKSHSYIFRIYQGMLHSTGNTSVKFVSADADMFNAMKNTFIKE